MKQKISPEFHIHINASFCSDQFIDFLVCDLGFTLSNFDNIPCVENELNIQPKIHYSLKLFNSKKFRKIKTLLLNFVSKKNCFEGYIEGEYVFRSELINKNQDTNVFDTNYFPFFLKLDNNFLKNRESEIHISMNRESSSKDIIKQFISSGFITAYHTGINTKKIIFTAQGTKKDISDIYRLIHRFLISNSNVVFDCKVKEERTIFLIKSRYCKYLPPQIEKVIQPNSITM